MSDIQYSQIPPDVQAEVSRIMREREDVERFRVPLWLLILSCAVFWVSGAATAVSVMRDEAVAAGSAEYVTIDGTKVFRWKGGSE